MTIKHLFPVAKPSLDLNFAATRKLDPRITFSRSSIGTYTDKSGIIRTAAEDEPRFDHDPVTGESLGLLIEEERTNLATYSEEFDSTNWAKFNSSIDANMVSAPNGEITSDALIENTATSVHNTSQRASVSSGTTYTFTVHAKANERSHIDLNVSDVVTTTCSVRFTLSGSGASATRQGSPTPIHSITALSGGWYRCQITFTTTSAGSALSQIQLAPGASSSPFYTGDGTSGIYIWGAQLEAGSFPTSYIPTTGSTVTRAADSASIEGANFSSWYNQSEGTAFVRGSTSALDANTGWSSFFQASSPVNNRISIRQGETIITSAGTRVTLTNSASPTVNETEEIAFAYKENDFAQYTSYANPAFQGTGLTPVSVDTLLIASVEGSGSAFNLNGHISRFAYYPRRLSDEQLQALTA